MSDIISTQRVRLTDGAATTTLRDFLRGGYQRISQPTLITYHAAILGTFVPGVIASPFDWRPSALLGAAAAAEPEGPRAVALKALRAPTTPKAPKPPTGSLFMRSAPDPFPSTPAAKPATRRAYRRLRSATPPPPSYYLAPEGATVHAEPPALAPSSSDPAWLAGTPGQPSQTG